MGTNIAFHSYRGGTGKTFLAIALAEMFAIKGKKVCLLDLDFVAPQVGLAFEVKSADFWTNDYLNGDCEIKKVLIDLSDKYGNNGQLLIGPANPSTEASRIMASKERKWEMKALGRLLSLKNTLRDNLKLDYLICDTTSGVQYSSINAIVASDIVLLVTTMGKVQIEGTRRVVQELYDLFEKKTGILLNKIPIGTRSLTEVETLMRAEYEYLYGLPILSIIPCFCDILEVGVTCSFLEDNPNHPFAEILKEIAFRVDSFSSGPLVKRKDNEIIRIYKEHFIKKVTGVRI